MRVDLAVLGACPETLAVLAGLPDPPPGSAASAVVVDRTGAWLAAWIARRRRLGLGQSDAVRGPCVLHAGAEPGALRAFAQAEGRTDELRPDVPDFGPRPTERLFVDFHRSKVVKRLWKGFRDVVAGDVVDVRPANDAEGGDENARGAENAQGASGGGEGGGGRAAAASSLLSGSSGTLSHRYEILLADGRVILARNVLSAVDGAEARVPDGLRRAVESEGARGGAFPPRVLFAAEVDLWSGERSDRGAEEADARLAPADEERSDRLGPSPGDVHVASAPSAPRSIPLASFRGRRVAVVGGGSSAARIALALASANASASPASVSLASPSSPSPRSWAVHLVSRRALVRSAWPQDPAWWGAKLGGALRAERDPEARLRALAAAARGTIEAEVWDRLVEAAARGEGGLSVWEHQEVADAQTSEPKATEGSSDGAVGLGGDATGDGRSAVSASALTLALKETRRERAGPTAFEAAAQSCRDGAAPQPARASPPSPPSLLEVDDVIVACGTDPRVARPTAPSPTPDSAAVGVRAASGVLTSLFVLRLPGASLPLAGPLPVLDDASLTLPGHAITLVGRLSALSLGAGAGDLGGLRTGARLARGGGGVAGWWRGGKGGNGDAQKSARPAADAETRDMLGRVAALRKEAIAELGGEGAAAARSAVARAAGSAEAATSSASPLLAASASIAPPPAILAWSLSQLSLPAPKKVEVARRRNELDPSSFLPPSARRRDVSSFAFSDAPGFEATVTFSLDSPCAAVEALFAPRSVDVWALGEGGEALRLHIPVTYSAVVPEKCVAKKRKNKVVVKLAKLADAEWPSVRGFL